MGVMDIFYDKEVSIYTQQLSQPNDLGIVETELNLICTSKAFSNPLTVQQAQEKYGLNNNMSIEFTVEYFDEIHELISKEQTLILMDNHTMYRVERISVQEKFYILDACITLACIRCDV